MAAQATLLLMFIILVLLMALPWTYARSFSVFKSTPDLVYPYHYGQLLDTVPVMSVLECALLCSRSSKCSGYDYHDKNRTCKTKGFVRNKPPTADVVDLESTSYVEIVCDEPPDIVGAKGSAEGFFTDAVTTYTCLPDYTPCLNKPTSVCQSTGQWEDVTGLCGKFRWHNPGIFTMHQTHKYNLPCGPASKFTVNILATPTQRTRFSVSICRGHDVLFHASFRLNSNHVDKIEFNTRMNGKWGRHREEPFKLIVGKEMEILISSKTGVYMMEIKGVFNYTFNSRVTDQKAGDIHINDDVSVSLLDITA